MTQNQTERSVLITALVGHILPMTDGVGGIEAGVPKYLEQLLASKHGKNYVALIDWGLLCIETEYQDRYGNNFSSGDQQKCVDLLNELSEIDNQQYLGFWRTLIKLCLEGFLTHPRHGGNREAQGWKMMQYKGDVGSSVSLSVNDLPSY